ncbi:MAG: hypothetical protein Q9196_003825 [Gyalolechia fulgens]
MDPPTKRRRLLGSENPDVDLHERRARNDRRLKSIFEAIFEKYSKDFSDVGDVIDFTNEEIVIDNGHIMNMSNEKDPGDDDQWSDDRVDLFPSNVAPKRYPDVVPDSQDLESSDDDPLALPDHVVPPTVSSFRQGNPVSSSETKTSQSQDGKGGMERQHTGVSSSGNRHSSTAAGKVDASLYLQNNPTIEEAWQVPPLPEDENVRIALPSSALYLKDDSDSTRSASPPGISIWAPVAKRRRSRAPEIRAAPWTIDEKELLRHYKTCTDLTFEDMCKHFPGRTSNSLRKRWQILTRDDSSIILKSEQNLWTQEEDQLLHRLKTSSHKTYEEVQRELVRHSIGAVKIRWYQIRQTLHHPLKKSGTLLSDPSNLSSSRQSFAEKMPCQIDPANELSSLKSPHAQVEWHPSSTEAEREETLTSLRQLESDQTNSCSEDELGDQKRFPSDMVVPDSQASEGTHHLNQSLNPRTCLRRRSSSKKIDYDDTVVEITSRPSPKLGSVSETMKLQPYPIHRQSPQSTTALCLLKRNRIVENDEKIGQILSIPNGSPRPSVDQRSSKSGEPHEPDLQYTSNPISESAFGPKDPPNNTHVTGVHCSNSATSNSHLEYSAPNSSTPRHLKPNELILRSVNVSCANLAFSRAPAGAPVQAENPQNSGKGHTNESIEINSPPPAQTCPTGSEAEQYVLNNYTKTNTTVDVVVNHVSDELSLLESKDTCAEVVLQSSGLTPEMRCETHFTTTTANDGSPPCVGQNPESSTKEQKSSPEATDASEAMEPSQEHIAHVPPLSEGGSPFFEHHPADDLVFRSGKLTKRLTLDVSGHIRPQAIYQSSDTPLATDGNLGGKTITPCHKRVSVKEPAQIADKTALKLDLPIGDVDMHQTEQGFSPAGGGSKTLSDIELPSTRGYTLVEKPLDGARIASTEAEAIPCRYFYRVEIPKPSSIDSTSSVVAPLSQEHSVVEHELHPTRLPSEDEAHAGMSQGPIYHEGLEHSDFSKVGTDEEHRYTEQQIQTHPTTPPLLGPTLERQAAEDIEKLLTATQTSGCHLQDSVFNGNCLSTTHDCPPDISTSNQKQDMVDEDDEDDLHLFLKPAITLSMGKSAQQVRNRGAARLVFRAPIDDADMSDDELSTPLKITQKRIEMTPVRCLAVNR